MNKALSATLAGGFIAGVLDILYAFIVYGPLSYGMSPLQVLQSVAAGWVGRDASRAGGWETGALGLGTHFLIAIIMAAVFVFAGTKMRALLQRPILWGFLYGLVLYVAMNYVVAPLSAAGAAGHFAASAGEAMERLSHAFGALRPSDPERAWMLPGTIFTHTFLVGIPIALAARRFLRD
ncbi:MAG: hypothetical protein J0L81_07160 [Caulobacterales bacterium]|jgi:hypothetical protein|nr:hypothetical protein [Caulobacterales bacterium]